MAKRVVLAVAGAGKTYHISRAIDPAKKNLILAYTHENVKNIYRELIDAHGSVPHLTTVMTFDSFVYRFLVCPYIPTIANCFNRSNFVECCQG
jgi:DNA helicase-2/ATP-dependent DNA helicase PcrA